VKIFILFSTSEIGGAERSLTRMAAVPVADVEYLIGTFGKSGPLKSWCNAIGLTCHEFNSGRVGFMNRLWLLFEFIKLAKHVAKNKYDVIYVVGFRLAVYVRVVRFLFRTSKIVHAIRWNPDTRSKRDKLFKILENRLNRFTDKYITNSEVAAKNLLESSGVEEGKIEVVYNGVDAKSEKIVVRRKKVVTVANLSARKGCMEYLEQVVAVLCKARSDIEFVFVGRDDMFGALQAKCGELGLVESVRFTGFLNDVSSEIEDSSVFVLPSRYGEGCPTSILEAMICRLPVVAFAIDGIPELVENNESGFLVERFNYDEMGCKISMLINDPELVERLGRRGRAIVKERFAVQNCARRHAEIFRSLAN
jgi:glycosyltransferase involved in cell wall biosynthesis